MQVAFRVDASSRIGTGHVVRCLTLAHALRNKGAECLFVHRLHVGNMAERIQDEGFPVLELPAPERAADAAIDAAYAQWLGVPQAQDAEETRAVLEGCEPDWLVIDHYALDAKWESALYDTAGRIAVFDDLANRPHDCDLLLDQNYFADPEGRYSGRVPSRCQLLTGPRYALLRPEYAECRDSLAPYNGQVRRALVFFGGTDPDNLTGRALEALSDPAFADVAVDAVVGPNNPHRETLAKQAEARPGITTLHDPRPHLADLMAAADLAIGAGGATTWERCCLGLPSLVVSIADNQRPTCEALATDGLVVYLGHHDQVAVADMREPLRRLLAEPSRLCRFAEMGMAAVDGLGLGRVVEHLGSTG